MSWSAQRRQVDAALLASRALWHPQPFRELQPAWCAVWPELAHDLLQLSDSETAELNDDQLAARRFLGRFLPEIDDWLHAADVPQRAAAQQPVPAAFWDWEIPGRKRAQIEAFAAAADGGRYPVLDWCGGKGHLGRLLALSWQVPVHSLDFDAALCAEGEALARRAAVAHAFVATDALQTADWPKPGQHAVALHACGDLHRRLVQHGVAQQVAAFDLAPCCYHRGVAESYQPLAGSPQLRLSRDDLRLAVTETVTANGRERRLRDQALAWKLGFDAYRRQLGANAYQNFKPVPDRWLRASFAEFMQQMTARERLPALSSAACGEFEAAGRRRRDEVLRYSIVRHTFRRAIEVWLALDLAVYLENAGYSVQLGAFCPRQLTPRNLLLSAQRA